MYSFICHKCGEGKNTVGHRWPKGFKNLGVSNHKINLNLQAFGPEIGVSGWSRGEMGYHRP